MLRPEGTPRQGRMRNRRFNNTVAVLTAVAALVIAPASASAGSLLSGYGGPGEGNQAILGVGARQRAGWRWRGRLRAFALGSAIGRDRCGGSRRSEPGERLLGRGSACAIGRAWEARAQPRRERIRPGTRARAGVPAAGAAAAAAAAAATSGSSAASAPAGQTLGLTGTDLLYVLLVVAALALTGFATSRIARRPEVGSRAG